MRLTAALLLAMFTLGCTTREPKSLVLAEAEGKQAYQQQKQADVVAVLHGADWNSFIIERPSVSSSLDQYLDYNELLQALQNLSLSHAQMVLVMLPIYERESAPRAQQFRSDMKTLDIDHVYFQQGSSFLPPRRLFMD